MKIFIFSLLLLFSLTASSCSFLCGCPARMAANNRITIDKGAIPPDFGKQGTTLIVTVDTKPYTKFVTKAFPKYYHGRIAFVPENQLGDSKYANKEEYRYVFTRHTQTTTTYSTDGRTSTTSSGFTIIDRKDNKEYSPGLTSSFYGEIIKVYARKLEEVRQEYR